MADNIDRKRVTLHPLKDDGTMDLNTNLYPKTFLDGIVNRDGEEVDVVTQPELDEAIDNIEQEIQALPKGDVTEEHLQEVKTELEDEIDTKATPEDIQIAVANKVTTEELDDALETKQDKLPHLSIDFSDYYNSEYPSNNISLNINNLSNNSWEGMSIEVKQDFLDAFHSLTRYLSSHLDTYLICGIYMSYHPSKEHLVMVERLDSNTLDIQIIDDTLPSNIRIRYNPKEDKFEYNLSRWIGASTEERLIVLDSANNYIVDGDNVILPPYISSETYTDRLNDVVNLIEEWVYSRAYPSVTLKIINSNTFDSYSSAADKVYIAQLCMTYDKDNNIYKAILSTCDGNFEITYGNEEDPLPPL